MDHQAKICQNHGANYPKHDHSSTLQPWYAINRPEDSLPHAIESSRPLGQASKRRRYRNSHTPRYHMSQARPPRASRPPPNPGPSTPPPPTTLSNKHHGHNNSPKPAYHINSLSTPYSSARLRPPPWLNKKSNKNRNKYYYGTHPPTGTTVKQRPPPRPNIPTPIPILSIGNPRPPPWPIIHDRHCKQHSPVSSTPPSRPPPWPIIPRYIHSTPQNRQNAKRRIKAKSRGISDKVSV